jgi:DNA-binding transcriptional MerR regulator
MRMQKRQFRIGELAKHLGVERFVVRFWEREFDLRPTRSDGGQRFYEEKDLQKLQMIKDLLYEQGLTIAGAKKLLHEHENVPLMFASHKTTFETITPATEIEQKNLAEQVEQLKEQLYTLRTQLAQLQERL